MPPVPSGPAEDLEDRYRLLVDLIPDGVVVHQEGRIVYVNQSGCRMVGRLDAEILGHPITAFVHPDSHAGLAARIASLVEPGVPSSPAPVLLVRPDGSTVPVESVSVRTFWEGRPALQAILRDLTVSHLAEAALRYQATLVQHVGEAIIGTDATGVVNSWNPAAEAIFGRTAQETVGGSITSVLGASLHPALLVASGPIQTDVPGPRSGNGTRSIRASATVLSGDAGYVLLCADETSRKEAEQRFSTVVAALEEGVVVAGQDGRIESLNPAAERILGVTARDLLGHPASALPLLGEDGVHLGQDNPLAMTQRSGRPRIQEIVCVQSSAGTVGWLSANTRMLDAAAPAPAPAVITLRDITERRATLQQVQHAATHDPLTDLPNRALLLTELSRIRSDCHRAGAMLAVLFIDLDGFKMINDSAGHDVGDEALQLTARRLSEAVRSGDLVSRLGGDEFVVLTRVRGSQNAHAVAQRLLSALGRPLSGRLRTHHLQASVGLITVGESDERTAVELIRDADTAMYQAKVAGRNRVTDFNEDLRAELLRRIRLGQDLRGALTTGSGLWVAYQPLIEAGGRSQVGAEALARWDHPELGAVNPLEFVSVAEQSDSIHALGRLILQTACRDFAERRTGPLDGQQVSVNVSARQLDDPALASLVGDALQVSGLPPAALCLEVTESALAADEQKAARILSQLRELGVRLAIDDFGTGYSSLARLRTLPVDELKIDRSFVTPLQDDAQARLVVSGIIALAHGLEMIVVAEGVETAEHAEILSDLGCDLFQGYHFGRPTPIGQL